MKQKKSKILRDLLKSNNFLPVPSCFDALSAKLIEQVGFKLMFMSGFAASASRIGQPDLGVMTLTEVLDQLNPLVSESFNIFFELPLKTISRGYKYKIIPISYYNRTVGEAKFKIDELGSKYLFTLLYCFLEKSLLRKDIKKNK